MTIRQLLIIINMLRKIKFIQTSFLIPLHENKDIGNARLHPRTCWTQFQRKLYVAFGAWTLPPGHYKGSYKDPDSGREVTDVSRKYILAVPERDLKG